jgi:catechol 2,3-dioxygenase
MDTLPLDLDAVRDDASGARRLPEAADMGHVHLEVTDLEASRAFYAGTVGLNLRQEHDGASFLAAGGYHHHVGLNVWNGRSVPAAGRGLTQFELLVPDGDLTPIRERLDAAGLAVSDTDGGFSVDDPYGIGVVFTAATP